MSLIILYYQPPPTDRINGAMQRQSQRMSFNDANNDSDLFLGTRLGSKDGSLGCLLTKMNSTPVLYREGSVATGHPQGRSHRH